MSVHSIGANLLIFKFHQLIINYISNLNLKFEILTFYCKYESSLSSADGSSIMDWTTFGGLPLLFPAPTVELLETVTTPSLPTFLGFLPLADFVIDFTFAS